MKYNYHIIIEYDGTGFNGWQLQKNGLSIQGEIEKVLKKIIKKKFELLELEEPTLVSMLKVNPLILSAHS